MLDDDGNEVTEPPDALLDWLEIGDPRPHPVDPADWGTTPEP